MRPFKTAGFVLPVLGFTVGAHAGILDQDGWVPPAQAASIQGTLGVNSANTLVAQTFTAGASGWLHSVEVQIAPSPNTDPTGPLVIGLYGVTGSGAADIHQPLGPTVTLDPSQVPDVPVEDSRVVADFYPFNFELVAGQQYAIVASMPSQVNGSPVAGTYIWGGTNQDSYSGGSAYFLNPAYISNFALYTSYTGMLRDLSFQAFYETQPIPEPASVSLLALVGLTMLGRPRRCSKTD